MLLKYSFQLHRHEVSDLHKKIYRIDTLFSLLDNLKAELTQVNQEKTEIIFDILLKKFKYAISPEGNHIVYNPQTLEIQVYDSTIPDKNDLITH